MEEDGQDLPGGALNLTAVIVALQGPVQEPVHSLPGGKGNGCSAGEGGTTGRAVAVGLTGGQATPGQLATQGQTVQHQRLIIGDTGRKQVRLP